MNNITKICFLKVLNTHKCEPEIQYYYKIKSNDTINNYIYQEVLF